MKMNKWVLVIALVMSVAMATTGTLAYLTDRDSKANVLTFGNVEIELKEAFEEGAALIPGVDIEKKPTITNTGKNDAWVWMTISLPTALDRAIQGTETGSNDNVIHWNPTGSTTDGYVDESRVNKAIAAGLLPEGITAQEILDNKMTWNVFNSLGEGLNMRQEKIKEIDYNTYYFLYNKALAPNESTLPSLYKVFLDTRVDISPEGDLYFVDKGEVTELNWNIYDDKAPVIYVSAYAMQKEKFDSVDAAFAAYENQWGDKGSEYAEIDATEPSPEESTPPTGNESNDGSEESDTESEPETGI